MHQSPDILTSAGFWAAIATLWSAAGAWFTFFGTVIASRRQTREGVMNLIAGIEAEFQLVKEWASGNEGESGYLQSKTLEQLTKERPDWFDPGRQIFTFQTPTLNNFTASPYLSHLGPVVGPVVRLSNSIHRLFDYLNHYQTFVYSKPDLYQSVVVKKMITAPSNVYTEEERIYKNFIFGMNLTIHQKLIGGSDSTDNACLYKAYRDARQALTVLRNDFRLEPLPWWYWILHTAAAYLFLNGVWQVLRWFDLWRRISPIIHLSGLL